MHVEENSEDFHLYHQQAYVCHKKTAGKTWTTLTCATNISVRLESKIQSCGWPGRRTLFPIASPLRAYSNASSGLPCGGHIVHVQLQLLISQSEIKRNNARLED